MAVTLLTDDEVSLYGAGIHTNTDLFVWNGKEVRGKPERKFVFFFSQLLL